MMTQIDLHNFRMYQEHKMKNKISFSIKHEESLTLDGIPFNSISFINLEIDGNEFRNNENFKDSFLVSKEIFRSSEKSGKYLLFTCACGIADDGGWKGVQVVHFKDSIYWFLEVENTGYIFCFDKKEYLEQVLKLKISISKIPNENTFEPKNVIFPEEWHE